MVYAQFLARSPRGPRQWVLEKDKLVWRENLNPFESWPEENPIQDDPHQSRIDEVVPDDLGQGEEADTDINDDASSVSSLDSTSTVEEKKIHIS